MKYLAVVLVLFVAFTLGLVGLIHSRRNKELQLSKDLYFENVKHKVTYDMLKEYQLNIAEANVRLEQTKTEVADLTPEVKAAQDIAAGKKSEMDTCNNELNQIKTDIGNLAAEKTKTETEIQQKKTSLQEQIDNLKKEAETRSKVCNYIDKASKDGKKLCPETVPSTESKPDAKTS